MASHTRAASAAPIFTAWAASLTLPTKETCAWDCPLPIDERFPLPAAGQRPLGGFCRRRQLRIRQHHANVVAQQVLQARDLLRVSRPDGQHHVLPGNGQDFGNQLLPAGIGHERFLAGQDRDRPDPARRGVWLSRPPELSGSMRTLTPYSF